MKFIIFASLAFFTISQQLLAAKSFKAGPISNDADAKLKCPSVCMANGRTWDKQWETTKERDMAACVCGDQFLAGPIWNDADAKVKCPAVCTSQNSTWNQQWRTTVEGCMSTCDCTASSAN